MAHSVYPDGCHICLTDEVKTASYDRLCEILTASKSLTCHPVMAQKLYSLVRDEMDSRFRKVDVR